MADIDKVIKGLTECVAAGLETACPANCPYFLQCFPDVGLGTPFMSLMADALSLLKEQEEKMKHLNNITLEYEKEVFRLQTLLKEQEAVEPNEWIKCSDEMPEEQETIFAKFKGTDKWSPAMFARSSEDVRVVVVFADGTRRVSHSHTIDGKWECEKSLVKKTVTHWMPNPGLPEEGR